MPSLLDAVTEEMSNLPEHEVIRIKALAEHIIRLCEAYGDTGEAALLLVSSMAVDDMQHNAPLFCEKCSLKNQ